MRLAILCFCSVLAFPLFGAKFDLAPAPGIVPAAAGSVDVDRDDNGNDRIDVHVEHLAQPMNLSPARQIYVVWVQAPGGPPQNVGQIRVNNDLKGELKAVTAQRNFNLFITAEDDGQVAQPRGPVVLRTMVHQAGD